MDWFWFALASAVFISIETILEDTFPFNDGTLEGINFSCGGSLTTEGVMAGGAMACTFTGSAFFLPGSDACRDTRFCVSKNLLSSSIWCF